MSLDQRYLQAVREHVNRFALQAAHGYPIGGPAIPTAGADAGAPGRAATGGRPQGGTGLPAQVRRALARRPLPSLLSSPAATQGRFPLHGPGQGVPGASPSRAPSTPPLSHTPWARPVPHRLWPAAPAVPASLPIQPDALQNIHATVDELLPAGKDRSACPPGKERSARRLAFAGLSPDQFESLPPEVRDALLS